MGALFLGVLSLVLLVGGVCFGILYSLFRGNPDCRWRSRVLGFARRMRSQKAAEERCARNAPADLKEEARRISDRAWQEEVDQIPLEKLLKFSGIGPVTVSSLRGAGFRTLSRLLNSPIQVHGLGAVKIGIIRNAASTLIEWQRQAFTRGATPAAIRVGQEIRHREEAARREGEEREIRLRAIGVVLSRLSRQERLAREVTFSRYVQSPSRSVVPEEERQRPLPDLDEVIAGMAPPPPPAPPPRPAPRPAERPAPAPRRRDPDLFERTPPPSPRPVPRAPEPSLVAKVPVTPPLAVPGFDALDVAVQLTFAVARADGKTSRAERAVIEEHFRDRCAGDPVLRTRVDALLAHGVSARIDLDALFARANRLLGTVEKESLIQLAARVAAVSGGVSAAEAVFLTAASRRLGVAPPSAPARRVEESPAVDEAPDHRLTLGIAPDALLTPELIRRQYGLLVERFDPSRVSGMGREFVAMAERRIGAIRAAAEALLAPLRAPLEAPQSERAPLDPRHNPDLDAVFGG